MRNQAVLSLSCLATTILTAVTAEAQSLTMSAASLTDVTATAFVSGVPTVVRQVPAGLPLPYVDLLAIANGSTGQAIATARHVVRNGETEVDYEIHERTVVAGQAPLFASVGPHEVLLTLLPSAPMPMYMPVIVEVSVQASSTMPTGNLPLCEIDFDNDGTYEFQASTGNASGVVRRNLATQWFVRVRTQQAVAGSPAGIDMVVHVRVRRDLMFMAYPLLAPCASAALEIEPTFAGPVRFELFPPPSTVINGLGLLVLGAAMQPFGLPTSPPCLVVPRPDAVVITPGDGRVRVPVPPQLRPFGVFAQGAVFTLGGAMPTIAYDVRFQ
jgi:hypothetical protein